MKGRLSEHREFTCDYCGNRFTSLCTFKPKHCSKKCAYKKWVAMNPGRYKQLKKADATKRNEKIKAYQKKWNESKKQDVDYQLKKKIYRQEYRKQNPGKSTAWSAQNRDKDRLSKKKWYCKSKESLNDSYVKSTLKQKFKGLEFSQQDIELTRNTIKLKRLLNEKSREVKSQGSNGSNINVLSGVDPNRSFPPKHAKHH
jgi:hypothetical protein